MILARACSALQRQPGQPRQRWNLGRRTGTTICFRQARNRGRTLLAFNGGNTSSARHIAESKTAASSSVAELVRPRRSDEPRPLVSSYATANSASAMPRAPVGGVTSSNVSWLAACTSAVVAVFIAAWWSLSIMKRRLSASRKRVVVIGGGFAGMQIVKDLASACQVTLLDVRDYFEYTPGVLAAIVGGGPLRRGVGASGRTVELDRGGEGHEFSVISSSIRKRAAARIGKLQRPLRSVAPKKADVVNVTSPSMFTVRCGTVDISSRLESTSVKIIDWDYLVFATGSVYPGPLKPAVASSTEDNEMPDTTSMSRREYFADAAARIAEATQVLIVGGGVVGVELAAELASTTGRAPQRVILTHSASRLLDTLPCAASERATKWLKQQGVEVLVGEKFIQETSEAQERGGHAITNRPKYVGKQSGFVITPDEVIVTAGGRPATDFLIRNSENLVDALHSELEHTLPPPLDVPLDDRGGIRVDQNTLRVDCGLASGEETRKLQVFCVGDAASKPPERYLASYAHWEAEYVSRAILKDIDGDKAFSLKKFEPPPRFMCISLGPWDGIFLWGNRVLCTGPLAGLIKLLIELWFKNFLPAPYYIARHLPHMMSLPKE